VTFFLFKTANQTWSKYRLQLASSRVHKKVQWVATKLLQGILQHRIVSAYLIHFEARPLLLRTIYFDDKRGRKIHPSFPARGVVTSLSSASYAKVQLLGFANVWLRFFFFFFLIGYRYYMNSRTFPS